MKTISTENKFATDSRMQIQLGFIWWASCVNETFTVEQKNCGWIILFREKIRTDGAFFVLLRAIGLAQQQLLMNMGWRMSIKPVFPFQKFEQSEQRPRAFSLQLNFFCVCHDSGDQRSPIGCVDSTACVAKCICSLQFVRCMTFGIISKNGILRHWCVAKWREHCSPALLCVFRCFWGRAATNSDSQFIIGWSFYDLLIALPSVVSMVYSSIRPTHIVSTLFTDGKGDRDKRSDCSDTANKQDINAFSSSVWELEVNVSKCTPRTPDDDRATKAATVATRKWGKKKNLKT